MLIGLTGGMGCGKSSALRLFAEIGMQTLDSDSICHQLYSDKESKIFQDMKARWGDRILSTNGNIDRCAVAKLVFPDSKEREWLNSLLHPAVLQKGREIYENSNKTDTIFDVPLLFEVGWDKHFDTVLTVWTEPTLRLARLKKRGMEEDEIDKRDRSQLSPELKMEKADYVIINNGTLEQLKQQCKIIINRLNKVKK